MTNGQIWRFVIFTLFISLIPASAYSAENQRTALVIGNGAYKTGPLKNSTNDAKDMAAALRKLGFNVIERLNADKRDMVLAVDEFYIKLRRSEVGLFYFAGHGIQIQGVNYLIPVSAHVTSATDIQFEAMDAGRVLGKMKSAGNKLNIVILDACRDNPFKRSFRSEYTGLAQMDAPKGTVIAYATSPGSVAADGSGRNGIYTSHLLANIKRPELSLQEMFNETGLGVMFTTGDKQIPWISNTPIPKYYLTGGAALVNQHTGNETERPKGRLYVVTEPPDALVKVMNIGPKFYQGMELDPGDYQVEVSADVYQTQTVWVTVKRGEDRRVSFALSPMLAKPADDRTWREPLTGMEFVKVPGGCYEMGCGGWTSDCDFDEGPVHEV